MFEANVIVKITTEEGYEGVGGVLVPTEHSYDHSLVEAMKNLFPEILNKSIHDREKLTDHMLTRCVGLNPNAVSPIDIAMWDCFAKSLNLPMYKVLGAKRDFIQSYASTPLFETIEEYIDNSEENKEKGSITRKNTSPVKTEIKIKTANTIEVKIAGARKPVTLSTSGSDLRAFSTISMPAPKPFEPVEFFINGKEL